MSYPLTTPVAHQLGVLQCGGIPSLVQYVGANPASSGATTLVSAPPAGVSIVVLAMTLTNNTANAMTCNLQSHTTTSIITGTFGFPATIGSQITATAGPCGIFAAVAGEALDINLSASHAIGVTMTYAFFQTPTS